MKKNLRGKYILVFSILLILLFIIFSNQDNDNIRIRVIANSNDSIDLKIKKEVYAIVTDMCQVNYCEEDILNILDELKDDLDEYAIQNNISIECEYGLTSFPPKELNGVVMPGGEYQTLLVTIGEGKGNNYWTILYPEYFGITFEDIYSGEVEIKFYIWELLRS